MRRRSFVASSALLLLLACRGGREEPAGDTASTFVPLAACPDAQGITHALTCEGGFWSGFVWTEGGCLTEVAVDAWVPLHHERHELERVDQLEGRETWALGPIATGVADWSPRSASRWTCDEHDEVTFALLARGVEAVVSCEAWGPDAGGVAGLPGASADHAGCEIR